MNRRRTPPNRHETGLPVPDLPGETGRPRLVVSDGLPASCTRCKSLGYHVPMCVPCAIVRSGLAEDHPHDRLFLDEADEKT